MNKKRFHYIKIKEEEPKKRDNKRKEKTLRNIGHALTVVGTTISSMLLIFIIMMCIVVTVITVYVLNFADTSGDINLRSEEIKFTSMVYGYDADGNEIEIKRLATSEGNRIWADYEDISQNIKNAVVATEDRRFYTHNGVDWRRTIGAFLFEALGSDRAGQGGSTITQQLVKNITGDDEQTWERKMREIFRALDLEKKYSKDDIFENYLNRIWLGGNIYGVEAACQSYFGKSAKDVDIAEAAIIASMIKNPNKRSPYLDLENCKTQQKNTLYNMYEQGYININEYQSARVEKVKFVGVVYGDDFGYVDPRSLETPSDDDEEDTVGQPYEAYRWNEYEVSQDWYVDAAIDQVVTDYADLKGITYTSARKDIFNGGYKIYINEDIELQKKVEEKYRNPYLITSFYDTSAKSEDLLQSAFVLMDYSGSVLAVAGGVGDKPGDSVFNRATMAYRAPGSTMKPISTYSTAIQQNLITYSTLIPDKRIAILDGGSISYWPENVFDNGNSGILRPVWYGVRHSTNTIAVRVSQMLTPQVCYNQLTQNLGVTSLVDNDIAYSPITLGALTNGMRLVELAAAYQIFGNGGIYYRPMLYSRVIDSKGNVILEQDFFGNQAVDSDAAWVTNRMLRTVVTNMDGDSSAYNADLGNVEVIGKTGTSNDEKNLLFVGCTPKYVGVVWLGYDDGREIPQSYYDGHRYPAQIWHDVMVDVEDTSQVSKFSADPNVIERRYCTETGLIASSSCTSTDLGYYRPSNVPRVCSGNHKIEVEMIQQKWDNIDNENYQNLVSQQ